MQVGLICNHTFDITLRHTIWKKQYLYTIVLFFKSKDKRPSKLTSQKKWGVFPNIESWSQTIFLY